MLAAECNQVDSSKITVILSRSEQEMLSTETVSCFLREPELIL